MWDLPGPGLEPVSPALAGGFLTTVPPGKPPAFHTLICHFYVFFDEVPVQIFCPFVIRLFVFSLLKSECTLYILDTSPLSDMGGFLFVFVFYFLATRHVES